MFIHHRTLSSPAVEYHAARKRNISQGYMGQTCTQRGTEDRWILYVLTSEWDVCWLLLYAFRNSDTTCLGRTRVREKKKKEKESKKKQSGRSWRVPGPVREGVNEQNEQVSIPFFFFFFSRCRYAYACEYRLFLLCKCALNPLTPMILFSTPTLSLEKRQFNPLCFACLLATCIYPCSYWIPPPFSLSLLSPIRRIAECKCISVQVQRN